MTAHPRPPEVSTPAYARGAAAADEARRVGITEITALLAGPGLREPTRRQAEHALDRLTGIDASAAPSPAPGPPGPSDGSQYPAERTGPYSGSPGGGRRAS